MAKRKISRSSEKGESAVGGAGKADGMVVRGIWGLVYSAVAALMLISMLFYSPKQFAAGDAAATHVLGPYFGTGLAMGLFFVFGRVAAFAFAAAVLYIGVAKMFCRRLRWKLLLFAGILTVELCLILAIRHIPALSANGFKATAAAVGANYAGLFAVNALSPLFGGRMFGPYFIVLLLMAITLMTGLRVKPQDIAALIAKCFVTVAKWFTAAARRVGRAFTDIVAAIKNSPDIRKPSAGKKSGGDNGGDKSGTDTHPNAGKAAPASRNAGPADPASPADPTDHTDPTNPAGPASTPDITRELTPEELEWERKKNAPIQIISTAPLAAGSNPTTGETASIPAVDTDGTDGTDSADGTGGIDGDMEVIENIDEDAEVTDDTPDDPDEFKVTEYVEPEKPYVVPPPDILPDPPPLSDMIDENAIRRNAEILEKTLKSFNVEGRVVAVSPGPVVTRYEIELAPGVKVSKVTGLQDDISLAVSGQTIRIQAPIPGKAAIGIELPNEERQLVHFKHILVSDEFKARKGKAAIPIVIGSDTSRKPYVADIDRMPHLLIAGQTGAGKSVCMNTLICSLLMTRRPDELRLIMIDPKQVEFAPYENIPHLLAPVVTESKEAVKALQWGVMEMERRYTLFKTTGTKKIEDFNSRLEAGEFEEIRLEEGEDRPLPYILIIVDELADLMQTAPKDVEGLIARISQKARAAGIHLVIATQRPEVKVVTGLIKSNLPSRVSFRTFSAIDSRTILDQGGAEKLLGKGDMLFFLNGEPNIVRLHGAFISDRDVKTIVSAIIEQKVDVEKIGSFHDVIEDPVDEDDGGGGGDGGPRDDLFAEAARITVSIGQGSTSLLQRRMNIGFARAGRIMDQLERAGIVGPSKGSKTREVLVTPEELDGYL